MNFGTKGCMYNCGDECTGECMKVETKTKMDKEPYITFLSKEEIIKHIEYLQTLDMPEVEKRGMISNWERCLNQNKDE